MNEVFSFKQVLGELVGMHVAENHLPSLAIGYREMISGPWICSEDRLFFDFLSLHVADRLCTGEKRKVEDGVVVYSDFKVIQNCRYPMIASGLCSAYAISGDFINECTVFHDLFKSEFIPAGRLSRGLSKDINLVARALSSVTFDNSVVDSVSAVDQVPISIPLILASRSLGRNLFGVGAVSRDSVFWCEAMGRAVRFMSESLGNNQGE